MVQYILPLPGQHRVYNLAVEAEHRYLAGGLGIVAHNAAPCPFGNSAAESAQKLVKFPNQARAELCESLGLTGTEDAHHLLPRKLFVAPAYSDVARILNRAAKGGFHFNGPANGARVPQGHGWGENTATYNLYTADVADRIRELADGRSLSSADARAIAEQVAAEFRAKLSDYWF